MEKFFLAAVINELPKEMGGFSGSNFIRKVFPALFYQRVTDILFRSLVKSHYQIANNSEPTASLDDQEANALRYAAGFVCRHLRKKIERSTHILKEELIVCLMTLVKGVQYPENTGTNEEWLDLVDRGGLWHVRENTFYFFCALEEEVQLQLIIWLSLHMLLEKV